MKRLWWWLAVPVFLVIIGVFAVSNRAEVALHMWPLSQWLVLPGYAVVLMSLLVGIIIGAVAVGFSGRRRRRVRDLYDRNTELTRQLDTLRRARTDATSGQLIEVERRERMTA